MKTRSELEHLLGTMARQDAKVVVEVLLDLRELLRDIKVELQKGERK